MVYDITSRDSFSALDSISDEIKQKAPKEIQIILVGNKVDLVNSNPSVRQIPIEEGQEYASNRGYLFIETSAQELHNVDQAFQLLSDRINQNYESMKKDGSYQERKQLTATESNGLI